MTEAEIAIHSEALVDWCKARGMSPHDGARVLTYTLVGIMKMSASYQGIEPGMIDEVRLLLLPESDRKTH